MTKMRDLRGWFSLLSVLGSPARRRFLRRGLSLYELNKRANAGYSFAGEAESVEKALEMISLEQGYAVYIAASNGVDQSCTLSLYQSGWTGLCVEMDPAKFARLAAIHESFPTVTLMRSKVTPRNVASTLQAAGAPKVPEFLNLDIDSYDLFGLEAILKGVFGLVWFRWKLMKKSRHPLTSRSYLMRSISGWATTFMGVLSSQPII